MNVTPGDYERWIDSLNNAEREELEKAGITGMLTEDDINLSHRIQLRDEDGLCVFQKNGVPRVCDSTSETHLVDDEEPMDKLRADLAEGLLRVIDWILGEASPKTIFRRPTTIAYRLSILCRVLNIGGFGECKLADLAREAGLTRAAFSKMAVNFRDCMGSNFFWLQRAIVSTAEKPLRSEQKNLGMNGENRFTPPPNIASRPRKFAKVPTIGLGRSAKGFRIIRAV